MLPSTSIFPHLHVQVLEVFADMGKVAHLATVCVYGGVAYESQEGALARGIDVVVGTPGRVKDLITRGSLKLTQIR